MGKREIEGAICYWNYVNLILMATTSMRERQDVRFRGERGKDEFKFLGLLKYVLVLSEKKL